MCLLDLIATAAANGALFNGMNGPSVSMENGTSANISVIGTVSSNNVVVSL